MNDMVCVRTKDDRSVLHSACASSNVDVVRRLLKAGADVNVQSKDGATPIARVSHPLLYRVLYHQMLFMSRRLLICNQTHHCLLFGSDSCHMNNALYALMSICLAFTKP